MFEQASEILSLLYLFLLLFAALASLCCYLSLKIADSLGASIFTPKIPPKCTRGPPKCTPGPPQTPPRAPQDDPKTLPRPPFGPSWPLLKSIPFFYNFFHRFLPQLDPSWGVQMPPKSIKKVIKNQYKKQDEKNASPRPSWTRF